MMAEDSTNISDDDLQDVSLIDTPIALPTDEPSSTEDTPKDEGSDTQDKPQEEATEANDSEATAPPEQAPEQPVDERKLQAQKAYQERQRTRSQIADQLDQNFGPKSQEDLVEEGLNPQEAQIQALREEMAYKEQRAQIAELNSNMQSDALLIQQEVAVFNPNSPEFDPEFTEMVDRQYQQAARLQTTELQDGSRVVVNAEVPLYDFYKQMADIYSRGASKGSQQGQQEAMATLSRTENPGGSPSTSSNGDSLEDLEERLGNVVIT